MDITNMNEKEIMRLYSQVTFDKIQELAYYLDSIEFPEKQKIPYQGPTASKVNNPVFWLEWDDENEEPKLRSNLVPDKPRNLYFDDLLNYRFLIGLRDSVMKAAEVYKTRDEARRWIEAERNACIDMDGRIEVLVVEKSPKRRQPSYSLSTVLAKDSTLSHG